MTRGCGRSSAGVRSAIGGGAGDVGGAAATGAEAAAGSTSLGAGMGRETKTAAATAPQANAARIVREVRNMVIRSPPSHPVFANHAGSGWFLRPINTTIGIDGRIKNVIGRIASSPELQRR